MKLLKYLMGISISVCILSLQNSFAQVTDGFDIKKAYKENREKASSNLNIGNSSIELTSENYDRLKKEGKLLAHYEYKISKTKKNQPIAFRPGSTNSLTPCDEIPFQGPSVPFTLTDDDTEPLTIPFNFCFYGVNYTSCNVSINGNIQFSSNSTAFSSTGFPSTTVNMIAPFWADVDLDGGGSVLVDVYSTRVVFSWESVGYYNAHSDKTNSFQLVITDGTDPILPPLKNVGFSYTKMEWTTGDASDGLDGFPDPAVANQVPATVGINQGNGIDYFLIGRFGSQGSVFDGAGPIMDGISYLDGKKFFFNTCVAPGGNFEPFSNLGYCDTFKVCGNDKLILSKIYNSGEVSTQTVNVTASAPSLAGSFSYTNSVNGNNTTVNMSIDGSTASNGYHIITISGTDNGTPSLTNAQTFVVFVDKSAANNVNATIVLSPTIGICPGGVSTASISVTGGAPSSILWNNNSDASSTSYTLSPGGDSTVYVTLTSGLCQKTITNYIHVNPIPTATISGNLAFCSGTQTTTALTASNTTNFADQSPYTYTWTGSPTNPSPSTTQSISAIAGTYSVIVKNKFNCTSSASVNVIVNTSPLFTVVPSNTTICANSQTSLSVNFGNSTSNSCGLATSGCATSNTFQVGTGTTNGTSSTVNPFVSFWQSSRHQYLYRASELIAAGVQPGKLNSIAFKLLTLSTETLYPGFTVKIKCTNATSLNSTFDNSGLNQVYSANTTINLGWNTLNFTQSYVWDGVSNILVDICHGLTSGIPSNSQSECTTTSFTSVRGDYESGSGSLCGVAGAPSTSSTRPNVRFGNCSVSASPNDYTFTWLPTTGLNNSFIYNPISTLTSSIQYTVVVTPTAVPTCSASGTTSLTVVPLTSPTITSVSAICSNAASFSLSALPTGGTWSVTPATSAAGVFTPSLATVGNNTVTYTFGGVGCAQSTTAIVPVERYVPSTIGGTIVPQCITNPSINLSTALSTSTLGVGTWSGNGVTGTTFNPASAGVGTHTITYSTNSVPSGICPSSSVIVVSVSSVAQPTLSAAGPYCTNFAVQTMTANPTGGTWSAITPGTGIASNGNFTPATSVIGNNTLLYTLSNGPCVKTESVVVNVVQYIPATLNSVLGPYCVYEPTVALQPIAANVGGSWLGNGVNLGVFNPKTAGVGSHVVTYSVNSAPAGLCPDVATTTIVVNPKPEANITSDKTNGCAPTEILFQTTTVNNGSAVWNFGDGNNSNGFSINHIYTLPGSYTPTLIYTDAITGCRDTTISTFTITIFDLPDAQFEATPNEASVVEAEIHFNNTTVDLNNNYSYLWNIGNLATSTEISPTYMFTNSGVYTVTMVATSVHNCIDTVIKTVTINPDIVLYVPNAFTPGVDGLNDEFAITLPPTGVDYATFSLTIFNRWGSVVYKTNDVNKFWNGALNNSGPKLQEGVYVWKISFLDEDKKYYEKVGHVSLIIK